MRLVMLVCSLLCSAFLQAQNTLIILPPEVSIMPEIRIKLFQMKKSLKEVMTNQPKPGQNEKYATYAEISVEQIVLAGVENVDFIKSKTEVIDSLQYDFFTFIKLIADGEIPRKADNRANWGTFSFGGKGQNKKQRREGNEQTLKPYADKFSDYFGSRYFLVLKLTGTERKSLSKRKDLYGGMKYQVAIVDAHASKTVYFKEVVNGLKELKEDKHGQVHYTSPVMITKKKMDRRIKSLLDGAIAKHRALLKKQEKRKE